MPNANYAEGVAPTLSGKDNILHNHDAGMVAGSLSLVALAGASLVDDAVRAAPLGPLGLDRLLDRLPGRCPGLS